MDTFVLKCSDGAQQALDEVMENGQLRVVPTAFYERFTQDDISGFCLRHGLYCVPTTELVDKINELILEVSPTRSGIEIGSGNGALGKALGIPCTDNHMQDDPTIRAYYQSMQQPTVQYGSHVERLDAEAAVERYRPEVVVAAWVTHKFNESDPDRGGNMFGVDEIAMLGKIKRYIFVGNFYTHQSKPLLGVPHSVHAGEVCVSRSLRPRGNAIVVWDRPDLDKPRLAEGL